MKLLKFEDNDKFYAKLKNLVEEIESWEVEEDDEATTLLYHNLVTAKAIYLEYFLINKDEAENE